MIGIVIRHVNTEEKKDMNTKEKKKHFKYWCGISVKPQNQYIEYYTEYIGR